MIYFKGVSKIILVLALMALGNSLMVSPALELCNNHIAGHEQENSGEESACCFICHSAPFQWIANASNPGVKRMISTSFVFRKTLSAVPDPLIGSIFRPPLVY